MEKKNTGLFCQRRHSFKALFIFVQIIFHIILPADAFNIVPVVVQQHQKNHYNYKQNNKSGGAIKNSWTTNKFPEQGFVSIHRYTKPISFGNSAPVYNVRDYQRIRKKDLNYHYSLKKKQGLCDGKSNIIQDLAVLALVTGFVGTVMSIFTASYYSVLGNAISILSGVFGFATGIPSAILTYLAVSDRISYTISNVLSVLSLLNGVYSFWSVDFGNKDIFISQAANVIGVFSLFISIVTTFPELFDVLLYEIGSSSPQMRYDVYNYVNNYGCEDGSRTFFEYFQDFVRYLVKL